MHYSQDIILLFVLGTIFMIILVSVACVCNHIRFLSIGSRFRSTLPPHARSPSRSCASLRSLWPTHGRTCTSMKQHPDTCSECGRNIPELEPATRVMMSYPSRSRTQNLTLVCIDCLPLHRKPITTCKGCNRPLRLFSGFAGPFCSDQCFQLMTQSRN